MLWREALTAQARRPKRFAAHDGASRNLRISTSGARYRRGISTSPSLVPPFPSWRRGRGEARWQAIASHLSPPYLRRRRRRIGTPDNSGSRCLLPPPLVDASRGPGLDSIPTKSLGISGRRCRSRHRLRDSGIVRRRPTRTRPLTTRATFHGSGAVAFSTKGEYGVRLMVQLGPPLRDRAREPRGDRDRRGPAARLPRAARHEPPGRQPRRLDPRRPRRLRALAQARRDPDERGAPRPRGPDRADELRVRRPDHLICDRSARCTVNVLWVKVRDAITGTLDAMTLADLVPPRHIDLDPQPTLTGAPS